METLIAGWACVRDRIVLHPVPLHDDTGAASGAASEALKRQARLLRRYDACLLPVTLATLGWTRTALAAARDDLQTPLLGLVRDMSAAGLQDLLSFGLTDFMRDPLCVEEFKTRLIQLAAASGVPRQEARAAVARPERQRMPANKPAARADVPARSARRAGILAPEGAGQPFQAAKAKLVTEFERRYICDLLQRYQGNISQAARAAHKNRRAFWQLMRKHDIAADPYRRGSRADGTAIAGFEPQAL